MRIALVKPRCKNGAEQEIDMIKTILTAGWLLMASVLDIRSRRLPVWFLALGAAAALLAAVCRCLLIPAEWLEVIKGCIPGAVLLLTAVTTKKAGTADGIALICLGMCLDGGSCLLIFMLSLLLISVFSGILLALHRAGRNTTLPYLPFLFAAWLLAQALILK